MKWFWVGYLTLFLYLCGKADTNNELIMCALNGVFAIANYHAEKIKEDWPFKPSK